MTESKDPPRIVTVTAVALPYLVEEGPPVTFKLPMPAVELVIHSRDGRPVWREHALIDTGAEYTLLPTRLAEVMGVHLDECQPKESRATVGGHVIREAVFAGGVLVDVAGCQVRLHAGFGENPWDWIILGREDFLRAFDARFDQRNYRMLLTPFPDTAAGELTRPNWWEKMRRAAEGTEIRFSSRMGRGPIE
jgi:hypothetical protein